jgi:hypothetical protein
MGERVDRWLPLVAGLVLATPVLAVPWPPSSDLSMHEGMVALLARWSDPAFVPPGVYRLALGHGNQLFYLLAWPLAKLAGAGLACRAVFALTIAGTLAAGGRLAAHLGRDRVAALALAPVALGWAFYWGFAPQMLGFALWLAALPRLDDDAARGSARTAATSSLAVAVLGLAHIASMLCATVAIAVFALTRPLDRRTPLRLLPALVGVALSVVEGLRERADASPLARVFASRVLWHPPVHKILGLVGYLVGDHGAITEATIGLLVVIAAILWRLVGPPRSDVPAQLPRAAARPWLERQRFTVVAAVLFALYLAAPYSVNYGAFLYVRFLAPAFALGVLLMAPPAGIRGPLVLAPAVALLLAPMVAALPQLSAAIAQDAALEPLIARIEEGSSVAVLHFGKHDHGLRFDPTAFGNRVLAERGGRELASFADYPVAPVVFSPGVRWDSIVLRVSVKSGSLQPATDLTRIAWLLVHVHDGELSPVVVRALSPEARLVDASHEWMLFHSRLGQLPLTSADAEPDPSAETVQERVTRALQGGAVP